MSTMEEGYGFGGRGKTYARRRSSSSSSLMSSLRSYLLKMAAISAASLSDSPYRSGWKPYVSLALLRVR